MVHSCFSTQWRSRHILSIGVREHVLALLALFATVGAEVASSGNFASSSSLVLLREEALGDVSWTRLRAAGGPGDRSSTAHRRCPPNQTLKSGCCDVSVVYRWDA